MKYEVKKIKSGSNVKLLDFLFEIYPNYSKKTIKKLLTSGRVLVNNKIRTKYDYLLNQDYITIFERVIEYKNIKMEIIYEDNGLIVVNKPSKLLSVSDDTDSITAFRLVSDYVKIKNKNLKIYVVHRLDRDTSGLLMFSKSKKIKEYMQENWDELVLKRGYLALLEGILDKISGRVTSYLKETKTHYVYSTSRDGKKAITDYSLVKTVGSNSLVQIYIKTGRKNQIRVHMKDIGHPIVGDKKYGSGKGKFCLCANELEFIHPVHKKTILLKINFNI